MHEKVISGLRIVFIHANHIIVYEACDTERKKYVDYSVEHLWEV